MITRRQFIEFGTKTVSAWALAEFFGKPDAYAQLPVTPKNTAKTVIFIQMLGGPTHMETWDMKPGPWNPADIDMAIERGTVSSLVPYWLATCRTSSNACEASA